MINSDIRFLNSRVYIRKDISEAWVAINFKRRFTISATWKFGEKDNTYNTITLTSKTKLSYEHCCTEILSKGK